MYLTTLWIAAFFVVLPARRNCAAATPQREERSLRGGVDDTVLPEDGGYWERLLESQSGSMIDSNDEITAIPGMVIVPSLYSFNETYDNLLAALDAAPVNVFAEIPHSDAAASVGLPLEPNKLVIFGNPNLGTPIMQANQTAGIDLPQKMLVWENDDNQVLVGYNSVEYLKFRFDGIESAPTLDRIAGALLNFASVASGVPINEICVNDTIDLDSNGLVTETSDADFETTWDRLLAAIEQSPANVALIVDHSANANSVGLVLAPTRLVVFGNPVLGTPLMQVSPAAGIDLPLKILVWEDANGRVQVTTNDIDYLASRHDITGVDAALDRIKTAIQNFMTVATVS